MLKRKENEREIHFTYDKVESDGLLTETMKTQLMTPGATAKPPDDEYEWLTKIIKVLNDTFGIEVTEDDKVEIAKMKDNIYTNEELMSYFNTKNSKDNIKDKFGDSIDNELLNFINTKLELYNKLSDDKVNVMFKTMWFNEIYDQRVRGIAR